MPREVSKPSIQLVNIPATSNGAELQLLPEREAQMSLCLSRTRVSFSEMPQTLERAALPQPRSSCWQPLGCLSPLCWAGIAGRHTTGRAMTDRRCCRRGTNCGKQEQQPRLPGQLRAGKGLEKWPGLLLMGKGQGRRARAKGHTCVSVWPSQAAAQGRVIKSAFLPREEMMWLFFFGLKNENYCGAYKHEKLICMPCHLEHCLPFHPGDCHIFHTMAWFSLENFLMEHFFLSFFIPSWTTLFLPLGKTLSRSFWQIQQLLKSSPQVPSSNPVVSVKKRDSSLPWQIQKHRKQIKYHHQEQGLKNLYNNSL